MMSRIRSAARIVVVILLLFLQSFFVPAQAQYTTATGTPTFTTALPVEMGFTNVANGNLHLDIPLASFPQRGSLHYNARLVYDSLIWKVSGGTWQPTNVPNSMGGWRLVTGGEPGTVTYTNGSKACDTPPPVQFRSFHTAFVWTSPDGASHRFPIFTMQDRTICQEGVSADTEYADDSSGYKMVVSNYTSATVYAPDGTEVYPTVIDTNGNFMSNDGHGNIVDTLGRTPVSIQTTPAPPPNTIIYNVLNTQGQTSNVTVTTMSVSTNTSFGQSGVTECTNPTTCSFTAIQSITFADGSSYSFTYDSGTTAGHFGELTSMKLRTGGTVNYGYTTFADGAGGHIRWLSSKSTDSGAWSYTPVSEGQAAQRVTVKDCVNNSTVYTFALNNGAWVNSASYLDSNQNSLGSVTTTWDTSNSCPVNSGCSGAAFVRRLSVTTQMPGGLSKQTTYNYQSSTTGQVSEIDESDYGTSPFPILRKTLFSYAPLTNAVSKPLQITVEDGSGNQVAKTNFAYDETQPTATSGVPQHNAATGSRGNATRVSRWLNTTGTMLDTILTYDDTGNVLTAKDPGGHTTQFSYADNFIDGVNRSSLAYPTQITLPDTNSPGLAHHITHTQYDFNTGLPTASIDQNGQQTTFSYDAMLRPSTITFPDLPVHGQTTFTYASPTQSVVQSKIDSTRSTYAITFLDTLGRTVRTAMANDEATGYDVQDFCYDGNGRMSFQSYPYQSSTGNTYTGTINCLEPGDTFAYDGLGRPTKVTHADGSSATTTYQGRARQIQDEGNGAGPVTRILQSDGLGRLAKICEVSSTVLLGSGGTPATCGLDLPGTGFLTSYGYDVLGNLTSIAQGSLVNRSFSYDSLSRLIQESEPEWGAGVMTYGYDNDGLLISRARPAPNQNDPNVKITTNYSYDELYRLRTRTYTGDLNGTPTATFNYDEASPFGLVTSTNPIGRLTSEISGNAKSALSYDPLGRVINNWQCTPLFCPTNTLKLLSYQYDLAGDVISGSNGAGVTFTYTYNAAPRLTGIASSFVDAQHPATLLSGLHYGPSGSTTDTLGNGLSESFGYNQRGILQSYTSAPYSFSLGLAPDLAITSANDSLNGNWTYAYDALNRLATSNKNAGAQTFTYDYDRYGNRWHQNAPQGGPAPQYLMDNTTNRISGSGISYDALGNVTNDGLGNAYTYDAESRIISAATPTGTFTYAYDAEGRRAEDRLSEYLFDLAGRPQTLFNRTDGVPSYEIIYAGGRHVATYSANTTAFVHADWLGTKRVLTGVDGSNTVTCASLPFGDALSCTGADRDFTHFTDDMHDAESNTERTWFRQLSTTEGRWLSPDPYPGSMDLSNPQSLNRYAYVMNDPLNTTDPLGLVGGGDPDDRFFDYLGAMFGGGGGGGCTLNGVGAPCGLALAFVGGGSAAICPDAGCSKLRTGSNGEWQIYIQINGNVTSTGVAIVNGQPVFMFGASITGHWFDLDPIYVVDLSGQHTLPAPIPSACCNGYVKPSTPNVVSAFFATPFHPYVGCLLSPNGTEQDLVELNKLIANGKPRSPDDGTEGYGEGPGAVWMPNSNSNKNGGYATVGSASGAAKGNAIANGIQTFANTTYCVAKY